MSGHVAVPHTIAWSSMNKDTSHVPKQSQCIKLVDHGFQMYHNNPNSKIDATRFFTMNITIVIHKIGVI